MGPVDHFFLVGGVVLFFQMISDLHKGKIDTRKNWLMSGLNLSLVLFTHVNIIHYLIVIIGTIIFTSKMTGMGDGDKDILIWVIPGFFLIDFYAVTSFLVAFFGLYVTNFFFKKLLNKEGMKTPGVPLILGAFVIGAYLYYAYITSVWIPGPGFVPDNQIDLSNLPIGK